jgi:murein DD-endopeptidase MepM/ murein hydrolase activator NlpD
MAKSTHGLKKLKKISVLLLLWLPTIVEATLSPKIAFVPGGVALVAFQTTHLSPQVFYRNAPVLVQKINPNQWQALIGIPLSEKSGLKSVTIKAHKTWKTRFKVKKYPYKVQHISLKKNQQKYLNPNALSVARIKQEHLILKRIKRVFSKHISAKEKILRPVAGVLSSEFGLKRFYNNKPKRPHGGLDFSEKINTPIQAAAAGRVILTGDFFFNGKSVFIDHGQGLISVYLHMNKINVEIGEEIKQSQIIGLVGKTGRATGSHLHWGIYLNQTLINPSLFL